MKVRAQYSPHTIQNFKTSEPAAVIDAAGFPHIIDAVLDAVRPSPAAFLPLAKVCRAWRDTVYKHIFSEVGITPIEGYLPNSAIRRLLAYRLTTVTEPVLRFELKVASDLGVEADHPCFSDIYTGANPFDLRTSSDRRHAAKIRYKSPSVAPLDLEPSLSDCLLAAVGVLNLHGEVLNTFFARLAFPNISTASPHPFPTVLSS